MIEDKVLYMADGEARQIKSTNHSKAAPVLLGLAILAIVSFAATLAATHPEHTHNPNPPKPPETQSGTIGAGTMSFVTTNGTATMPFDYDTWQKEQRKRQEREEAEQQAKENIWNRRPILDAPPDAPPSRVRVGPYIYTVHYTSWSALRAHNALAQTFNEDREIWLNPKRHGNLHVDMLHELLHCAQNSATAEGRLKGEYADEDENIIVSIAAGLAGILQDNPELAAWLQKPDSDQPGVTP